MAHIHEQIDFCVGAYIVYDHKVLLVDHKKLKTWMPIGGHVELDEDTDQALLREIKEECGLEVEVVAEKPDFEVEGTKTLYRPRYLDIHRISDTHQHIGLVYFCRSQSADVSLAAEEHNAIHWFSLHELKDPQFAIRPSIIYYAEQALAQL